jgi:hypothetical protein
MSRVYGWLTPATAVYLSGLEVLQRRAGPAGDVCEIGVHHGLSFFCMAIDLPRGERGVAIDLFGNALKFHGSGSGNRRVFFEQNIAKYLADPGIVDVIQANCLDLEQLGFTEPGRRFRMFSIDGGHTTDITIHNLRLAERTTIDGGLVIADDVLNPHWLGVITALFHYWAAGGTLVPAVMVPNRLILSTDAEAATACRGLMAEHFGAALDKRDVELGDHRVDVYREYPWVVADTNGGAGRVTKPSRRLLRHQVAERVHRLAHAVRPS